MNNLIILFGIPRTGSNNSCSLLGSSNNIILNSEDFNKVLGVKCMNNQIKKTLLAKYGSEKSISAYLQHNTIDYLRFLNGHKPEKYKLLKVFYKHLPLNKIVNIFFKQNKNIKKIILKRNFLDVYVSNKIAEKTKQWYNYTTNDIKITVNIEDFKKCCQEWNTFYKTLEENKDENTIVINYEDFSEKSTLDQYNFLKNNLEKLNIKLNEKQTIISKFKKQRTVPLSEQITNYDEVLKI